MLNYLKFFHYYLIAVLSCISLLLADYFIILGFICFVCFYALGDAFLGKDTNCIALENKKLINAMLYSALPLSILLIFCNLWLVSPNSWLIMDILSEITNYHFIEAKQNTSLLELMFAVLLSGFVLTGIATVVAHELVHRINKPFDVALGRWLLCFSFDANFSIEHVYHHHSKVATSEDPVTAPRGRNVYTHIIYAIYGTNLSAWKIEKKRLKRFNKTLFSWHNICLRGYFMSLVYLSLSLWIAGIMGVLMMLCIGFLAKIILEIANYIEHYGLVRDPKQPVRPKHSWNSNHRISSWAMFNLPRHSHHHAQASVPFDRLEPIPDAPMMSSGYISTIFIALIPPLWFKLMQPKLEQWDRDFANDKESLILSKQTLEKQRYVGLYALLY